MSFAFAALPFLSLAFCGLVYALLERSRHLDELEERQARAFLSPALERDETGQPEEEPALAGR